MERAQSQVYFNCVQIEGGTTVGSEHGGNRIQLIEAPDIRGPDYRGSTVDIFLCSTLVQNKKKKIQSH